MVDVVDDGAVVDVEVVDVDVVVEVVDVVDVVVDVLVVGATVVVVVVVVDVVEVVVVVLVVEVVVEVVVVVAGVSNSTVATASRMKAARCCVAPERRWTESKYELTSAATVVSAQSASRQRGRVSHHRSRAAE